MWQVNALCPASCLPERTVNYDLQFPTTWGITHGKIITGGSGDPDCPDAGK